jgi:hypothetical protein
MATATKKRKRSRARHAAAGKDMRRGVRRLPGVRRDWRIVRDHRGWITVERPVEGYTGDELLAAHADWAGPVKLMSTDQGPVQRVEILLGGQVNGRYDPLLHAEADQDFDRLFAELLERCGDFFDQKPQAFDSWAPPENAALTSWIGESGHAVAADKDENLRLTLHAAGRDGQVRIYRGPGQLRFVMPLGSWSQVQAASEAAMLRQAQRATTCTRLLRVAWRSGGGRQRCEAQVDLSGLPVEGPSDRAHNGVVRGMVRMALAALEIALRQLPRELDILADPRNGPLAESLFFEPVCSG